MVERRHWAGLWGSLREGARPSSSAGPDGLAASPTGCALSAVQPCDPRLRKSGGEVDTRPSTRSRALPCWVVGEEGPGAVRPGVETCPHRPSWPEASSAPATLPQREQEQTQPCSDSPRADFPSLHSAQALQTSSLSVKGAGD